MHVLFLSMGVWHSETSLYVVVSVVHVAIVHLSFLCEFLLGLPSKPLLGLVTAFVVWLTHR